MTYRNPTPTVDIIIETPAGYVLIERKNEPRGFALPGGFVDEGETVEHAAIREAKEETGLLVRLIDLLYVYSDPKRDPRQHTMSTVFIGYSHGTPVAADDAAKVVCVPIEKLIDYDLVFDHKQIVQDFLIFHNTGQRPKPTNRS
ncbi:MAG: NUDIX hydrolase [Leptonema sp. (in: Bacteria)]|nr:NUDIX hydrolase [Leptonema sp. (in: bacteria)]